MASVISKHIEITPSVCGGKPRIAGTRMPVVAIAKRCCKQIAQMYLEMGESIEEMKK